VRQGVHAIVLDDDVNVVESETVPESGYRGGNSE
jgi:hypothetical protein